MLGGCFCLVVCIIVSPVLAQGQDVFVLEGIQLAQLAHEQQVSNELDKYDPPVELAPIQISETTEKKEEPGAAAEQSGETERQAQEATSEELTATKNVQQVEAPVENKVNQSQEASAAGGPTAETQQTKDAEQSSGEGEASPPKQSVEINGDIVEYSVEKNMIIAEGNVVVVNKDMNLYCDKVEFDRAANIAYASGHVRLKMIKGEASEMTGDKLTFDVNTMTGTFDEAKIFAQPYYGFGKEVAKVGENHMQMKDDYVTTCDLEKPHFRLASRKMDVYPGDKLIARNVRMIIGKIPLLYIPRFTQDLTGKEPVVTFVPGMDKEWGLFLLSSWRYRFNENFKGIVHLDAREKRDVAWGIDLDYKMPDYGTGRIRTYYMNERRITSKRFFQPRPSPTIEKERFKVEWRHKWKISENTNTILQYYRLSDSTIIKDYFEREFDEDTDPNTYFLLTHLLPVGIFSYRTDTRVNRFTSAVERLPEVRYDLGSYSILNSGFFLSNSTMYSNLTSKTASPSEVRQKTMRVHTESTLSYPMKIGIFEMSPFVGGRNTYYSKTKDPDQYGAIRGIFQTGANLSTRFFKVFDVHVKKFGLDINRLRHTITPQVAYAFNTLPTTTSDQLDSFDSIDSLNINHVINFGLENKLQTKRNDVSVDLLRLFIDAPFNLKEAPGKGGFNTISADIDFKPVDWVTFFFDAAYDSQKEYLSTANFDLYINGGSKWTLDIGKRWNREVDDQLTTALSYTINPKWALRSYTRFDLRGGILKEQEYTLRRDLHCWTMDINFNETRRQGDELWMVFTLKAFPDMVVDFGTSFNRRKQGSQSSEGD